MKKFLRFLSMILVVSVVITVFLSSEKVEAAAIGQFEVHYINVGHGDCILIKQDSYSMLIDAGHDYDGTKIISYLKAHGVSKLDVLVATHPHADHIGGMAAVINAFSIGKFYMQKFSTIDSVYNNVANAAAAKGLTYGVPPIGSSFNLGNAVFTSLAPISTRYADSNNYSIVLRATFGSNSFLFEGDAGSVSETEMLSKGYILSAQVLKVAHHGEDTSTIPEFLNAVKPKYAVVSCGTDNTLTTNTINKLKSIGAVIYRTDQQGNIVAVSDGTNITFSPGSGTTVPTPTVNTPTINPAVSAGYNSIKVSWSAVTGAGGYEVYRSTSSTGTYSLVSTSTSTSFTDTALTTGTTYYYKVRAYTATAGSKIYSGYSAMVSAKPVPSVPTGFTAARSSSTSISLKWSAVSGASGYEVNRATSSTGSYSLIKTTASLSYTNTGLTTGRTYYYKIRAYRLVGTTRVYSNWTTVAYAKC